MSEPTILRIEVLACCATCHERIGTYKKMSCKMTGDPFPTLPHYKCEFYVDARGAKEWDYDLDRARENEDAYQ